jgi:ribonuclease III
LQQRLAYTFRHPWWLHCALTHRSYVHETGRQAEDYERLEFLGDAVLGLIVGTYLFIRYPHQREGQLSQGRAHLVSTTGLAYLARQLALGEFLLLGRGEEQSGGRDKDSLLAAAFEAVMAAIYLDGGLQQTQAVFLRCFGSLLAPCLAPSGGGDYKSLLQEETLRTFGCTPTYHLIRETGPAHQKTFYVQVILPQGHEGFGVGRSKKAAEQHAAKQLFEVLCQTSHNA